MKQHSVILVIFLALTVPNFAQTWVPGKMTSIKDASEFACSFEYSNGQGKIQAHNPTTQETFTGHYTCILLSDLMGRGMGYLKGNKGTVIFMTLEFSKGSYWILPVIYGNGEDNNGVKYQYQSDPK